MPLSKHEQRVIEALEQGLYDDDPHSAHRLSAPHHAVVAARRRLGRAGLGTVAGLVLLLLFCWTRVVAVGVLGYLLMFASLDTSWATASGMRHAGSEIGARRSWLACVAAEARARLRDWVRHHR